MAKYSRKWKVYVIQHAHGMLGWARSYAGAQAYYEKEIQGNLDLMDRSDDYPAQEQHRYTVDCTWIIREYLKRRPADAARVKRRMLEGRLELGAYEASVPDLCLSGEEVIRALSTRADLERQGYGQTALAVFSDIHAFSFGFPSLAAGSGINYMIVGTNTDRRCAFLRYPPLDVAPRGRALFRWEGIDGQQLLCFHYGNYLEASGNWGGAEFDPALLENYLAQFEAMGDAYPYDAVIIFGTGGDAIGNGGFYHSLLGTERIREWNQTLGGADLDNLDQPQLINGSGEQFFRYIEENFSAQVPLFRGGWGGGAWLWDTQQQRFGKAGLQARQSAARIRIAETLGTAMHALFGDGYAKAAINQVFQYRIWQDEHDTNGTRPIVTQAVKDEWRTIHQQWGAEQLEQPSVASLTTALTALASHLAPHAEDTQAAKTIVIYNPVARQRRDIVRWSCPAPAPGQQWLVTDRLSGDTLPSQYVSAGEAGYLLWLARDLPSLGYKLYTIGQTPETQSPTYTTGDEQPHVHNQIENSFYRIVCDESGAICSIWDKKSQRELVRAGSQFNRYVNSGSAASAAQITVTQAGPVACALTIQATGELPSNTQSLSSQIWLYHDLDRIDIVNEFSLEEKEQAVYFDFPLALAHESAEPITYTVDGPGATILTAGQHEFDEAKLEHWNVFGFADLSTQDYGVTFFSPDARQLYLGGRIAGTTMPQSDLTNAAFVVRVIGGGPVEQDWNDPNGGPLDNPYRYAFSLTSHAGMVDLVDASAEGWGRIFPLQVCEVTPSTAPAGDTTLPVQASLWQLPSPLLLSAFKAAEADDGTGNVEHQYILRLWNPTPNPIHDAPVYSDLWRVVRATVNDHMERATGPALPLHADGFTVSVGSWAMITMRVELVSKVA